MINRQLFQQQQQRTSRGLLNFGKDVAGKTMQGLNMIESGIDRTLGTPGRLVTGFNKNVPKEFSKQVGEAVGQSTGNRTLGAVAGFGASMAQPMGVPQKTTRSLQTLSKVDYEAMIKFVDHSRGVTKLVGKELQDVAQAAQKAADKAGLDGLGTYKKFGNEIGDFLDKQNFGSKVLPKESIESVIKEVESLRPNQKPIGAEMFKRDDSFVQMDDVVARERFDVANLKKVSFGGSDRDVYELDTGDVVKIAKSARGLAQNSMADWYAADMGLIPKIKEIGRNFVVFEKVDVPDANVKAMVKELKEIGQPFRQQGDSQKYFRTITELQDKMEEFGYAGSELANYGDDLLWGDFLSIRNWGTKGGKPIHLDEGSLNGRFVKEFADKAAQGIKNLDDPEFRDIYEISKNLRKKYGDIGGKTMYGITGLLMLGGVQDNNSANDI